MAVTLVGEVLNDCEDPATGWTPTLTFEDDPFVQGTGCAGEKVSNTTVAMYTDNLGATSPYNFSSSGTDAGSHIIMWLNAKIPINTTTGMRIVAGNGNDRGEWYVHPRNFYAGGFVARCIGTDRNFDNILAGTGYTTSGNPAQLTSVSRVGATFTTTVSIMGNFNTVNIDQFTVGSGLRVDAGTEGTPNTFETVRVADEDTAIYGWWSSAAGAYLGKGKLYIGPLDEATTSVFSDSAVSVIFADEKVSSGFYDLNMVGTGTDVTFDLVSIASAEPVLEPFTRWGLTVASNLNSFTDTNGIWQNSDVLSFNGTTYCSGTTMIDCRTLVQNSGLLEKCTIIGPDRGDGESFLFSDFPERIKECSFTQSSGHAIEFLTRVSGESVNFDGNIFTGFDGAAGTNSTPNSGPTNAAIFNNSSGNVTLNVLNGGTSPVIRNGFGATTTVVASISLTLTDIIADSEVRIYTAGTTTELDGIESSSTSFVFSFESGDPAVDIIVFHLDYQPFSLLNFTLPASNTSIPVSQIFDRNYTNP